MTYEFREKEMFYTKTGMLLTDSVVTLAGV
jgi:hypothetical protein